MALSKKPVNGMKDILPAEMEIRDYVTSVIKDTYRSFGFTPIETPCMENIANLSNKQGGENEKLIFKVLKRGEKLNLETAKEEADVVDFGMRYDLTVPLSRFYANNANDLPSPFKALQIGSVWRADRPQRGRYRQFTQCDIDILGEPSNLAEIELILATTTALGKICPDNAFTVRINDREILKAGELGNHLVVYEDRPMKYDAWDIDIYYQEKGYEVEDLKTVSVEKSSLMTKVKMDWNYQDSTISQEIRFYNDNRRIDFVTHADWHEHQQLLRVLFPLDIRTSEATFDIQYGNVKRPTYENTSWDMAKFETVAHQWADYSETGYGVSLMNDCKYGYSAKGYVLGMSLIKCGIHPDYAADQGIHDFTYALYPHSGSWQESGVQKEAWRLNNPLWTVEGAVDAEVQSAFCKADTDHVAIDCIKKAEDSESLIIRFHEYAGMRGPVTLNFGFPVDSWQETDLMENPDGEEMTGELKVTVRPYEIRTFRVTPTLSNK